MSRIEITKDFDFNTLESDYYRINGTKKILIWDVSEKQFFKPKKDCRGQYGGWMSRLEKQPKLKFIERVNLSDLYE
jgi:hypothetical protein